jgi:hypothetical protein
MIDDNNVPLNDPKVENSPWLKLARDAYRQSTTYLDANYRKQWERNIALFRSTHPSGSKYHSQPYLHRARLFRPKTRSAIRTNEAAAAAAFFSTQDIISVYPENDSDQTQRASARVIKHLLQFRLTKTIPWFQTLIAAYQESMVFGSVISHQYWEYKEEKKKKTEDITDDDGNPVMNEDGTPATSESEETVVVKDHPNVRLIAAENLRIDPAADWNNPIGSSPYVIEIIPMYLQDVIEKMSDVDDKTGEPKWKTLTKDELLSSTNKSEFDSTRQARQGDRKDPTDSTRQEVSEFTTVFIHKNIIRKNGKDWLFYTAGTQYVLTNPKPLTEIYPHLQDGERPYVMGSCMIEAHRINPSSLVELTQDLQTAANDIANQRYDNVQLVLNKRYHIRRSANIDIAALKRSVPGGSVMMDDPVQDVQIVNTPDVTASSYEEQDRLNVDFDDIAGTFSQATVQTNRNMNETVGGMEMLSSDANAQIEYMIRTFAETWVEPVLRQLIRLEQFYETDDVILEVAVNKAAEEGGIGAEIFQRFVGDETDEMLRKEMTIGVNVGIGATDPVKKIERLLIGIRTLADVNPDIIAFLNQNEITKEVFGALGYKDSKRFIEMKESTMIGEMQGRLEQMEGAMQALTDKGAKAEIDAQSRILAAQIKGQAEVMAAKEKALGDVQSTVINTEGRDRSDALRHQISLIDTRLKAEKNDIERGALLLQKESLVHKMLMETEPDIGIDPEGKKMSEVLQNGEYGKIQGLKG